MIFALLLGILVLGTIALGAHTPLSFLLVQALLTLVLVTWGLRLWVAPRPQLLWPPICWVVLAFMVYAVARYFTADVEYVARMELVRTLVLGSFFLALLNNVYRQESAQTLVLTLVALGSVLAFLAIYQFTHQTRYIWGYRTIFAGRAFGTYVSPNMFSCFLELLLPPVLAYLLAGRLKIPQVVGLIYGGLMLLTALALTVSRGGWLATAAGMSTVLVLLATHRHYRRLALSILMFLLATGGAAGFFYARHTAHLAGTPLREVFLQDWGMRQDMWVGAIRMWLDHLWFGAGPAHYDLLFRQYTPERMQLPPLHAHNDYLNLLADWGLVGALIVLAGMTAFIAGLVETWRHVQRSEGDFNSGRSNRFAFFTGACGALAALSVHSLMDYNLHVPANAALALAWTALLTGNQRFATERHWVKVQPPVRLALTAAFLLLASLLLWQGTRSFREQYWLARAEAQPPNTLTKAACLQKAVQIEPKNYLTHTRLGQIWRWNATQEMADSEKLIGFALDEFRLSAALNPHSAMNPLESGIALDWLGRHDEAAVYFQHAELLDPNGCFTMACIGWHYAEIHDYAAARTCLARADRLNTYSDPTAHQYALMVDAELQRQARGEP